MTWTAESLKQDASSKILMTINLTQHYQSPDAKPLFFNMDGTRDLTKEEECDCKPANKPRKIIIFVMYIIHRQIMKRVCLNSHPLTCISLCSPHVGAFTYRYSVGGIRWPYDTRKA
jgi:hypothetical protein